MTQTGAVPGKNASANTTKNAAEGGALSNMTSTNSTSSINNTSSMNNTSTNIANATAMP